MDIFYSDILSASEMAYLVSICCWVTSHLNCANIFDENKWYRTIFFLKLSLQDLIRWQTSCVKEDVNKKC